MKGDAAGAPSIRRRRAARQVFIVTPARSGSTLLRYLLDSHPDVTCPPELNLSALLQHLVDVWNQTNFALREAPDNGAQPASETLSRDVRRRTRKVIDEIMVTAANAAGASVYVDKSLTTVDHLATVSQCYPEASLIFLYRYPLDMIASGLEASRWGFSAFGFAPFVAANPTNLVAALANYWIDRVSKMLTFEADCELAHARIYYELLCDEPTSTLEQLFEFLKVAADPSVIERAFQNEHGRGPGDYKIDYSGSVGVDSIGRGATLPEVLSEWQVQRINELLAELDYPALDAGRRGDLGSLLGLKRVVQAAGDAHAIAEGLVRKLAERPDRALLPRHLQVLPIELVVRGGRGEQATVLIDERGSATVVDRESRTNDSVPRVRCVGDVLIRVADGKSPFARAVHEGLIRVELGQANTEERPDPPHRILAALAALMRTDA